jgi:Protein of unknown function
MSAMSHANVDGLILTFAKVQWRKVAMIISKVLDECGRLGITIDEHGVAERVCALVDDGQLEAQGNLSQWRHSEVRLPD